MQFCVFFDKVGHLGKIMHVFFYSYRSGVILRTKNSSLLEFPAGKPLMGLS